MIVSNIYFLPLWDYIYAHNHTKISEVIIKTIKTFSLSDFSKNGLVIAL